MQKNSQLKFVNGTASVPSDNGFAKKKAPFAKEPALPKPPMFDAAAGINKQVILLKIIVSCIFLRH